MAPKPSKRVAESLKATTPKRSKKATKSQKGTTPERSKNVAESSDTLLEWKGKTLLSTFDEDEQPGLYKKKLEELGNLDNVIVAERKTNLEDFRNFGLVEGFERLGWLAALTFNNDDSDEVYLDEIIESMSTLRRDKGSNPPWSTKLIGWVNEKKVTMSMESLLKIAPFDTKLQAEYVTEDDKFVLCDSNSASNTSPTWIEMLTELFEVPSHLISANMPLSAAALKPLPRLISKIFTWNVIPRKSDKRSVRDYDVRVLYALVKGQPMIPFRQVIMLNVWTAHDSRGRTIIPHCRLLTRLLMNAKVIPSDSIPKIAPNISFSRTQLGRKEFAFNESVSHFILHDDRNETVYNIPKDTVMHDAGVGGEQEDREYDHLGRDEPRQVYPGKPADYQYWTSYQKVMYDKSVCEYEETKLWRNEMKELIQCGIYQQKKYYNNLFDYAEQVLHHEDFREGREYKENCIPTDYEKLSNYVDEGDKLVLPDYPQLQPPDWWLRRSQAHAGESSSNARPPNPFVTSTYATSMWESIFGPPPGSR